MQDPAILWPKEYLAKPRWVRSAKTGRPLILEGGLSSPPCRKPGVFCALTRVSGPHFASVPSAACPTLGRPPTSMKKQSEWLILPRTGSPDSDTDRKLWSFGGRTASRSLPKCASLARRLLGLSKSDALSSSIRGDKFNSGLLEGRPNGRDRFGRYLPTLFLEIHHGRNSKRSRGCQLALSNLQ